MADSRRSLPRRHGRVLGRAPEPLFLIARHQCRPHQRVHQPRDITAELGHLPHHARADVGGIERGRHEDRFEVGIQVA
ncbi:MAG: hypothetical protein ACK55I_39640, partial [bacterium]